MSAPEATIYDYQGSGIDIVEARRQQERHWRRSPSTPLDTPQQLLRDLPAAFWVNAERGAYYEYVDGALGSIRDALQQKGFPDAVKVSPFGILLVGVGETTEMRETLSFPNFEGATAYARTFRVIDARLGTQKIRDDVTSALAGDREHELLVRVQDASYKMHTLPAKSDSLGTFREGYLTALFAGAHLVLGGAMEMHDEERFARAVQGYTRCAPLTGRMAPLARFGRYFHDFVGEDGITIRQHYEEVFDATYTGTSGEGGARGAHWLKGRNGYPRQTEDESPGQYMRRMRRLSYTNPYGGEGCPAMYHRIVYDAARLFMGKVCEISAENSNLPDVAPISFGHLIDESKRLVDASWEL